MDSMPSYHEEGVPATRVARTPSPLAPVASPRTLDQLEFAAALNEVARRAVSPWGASRVLQRRPRADPAWVADQLAHVWELASLIRRGDPFRPPALPDLRPALAALARAGSVLEGPQLLELGQAAAALRSLARELDRLAPEAPRLARWRVEPPPRELEQAIARALDPDGGVRDQASAKLAGIRRELRKLRDRLVATLERRLAQLAPEDRPPDAAVTIKDGRYAIPVRRGGTRVPGLVHGVSASGATVFVEPVEAVELGNQLRTLEDDEARAVLAVLRQLTEQARAARGPLEAGWELCLALDDLYARARYAVEVEAALPEIQPEPGALVIRGGRHPLLLAQHRALVPLELELSPPARVLVVSGPNTGGKTVLLETVGLAVTLAQAGVIPPVGGGTRLPVFARVFAEIGDHQSVAANLSSFSAHVEALREILDAADASSLVLVDEIGGATDPAEGAALASAVLRALVGCGATTLVTTHLARLKELAAATAGVLNGSLAFDPASLSPTYRFVPGVPGRSYGLAIARKLGLSPEVLAAAEAALPEAERSLDRLLAELEARRQALELREQELARREDELAGREQAARQQEAELERARRALEAERREVERAAREQAQQLLLDARRRVEDALALARAAVTEATAKAARRLVEEGVQQEAEALKRLASEGQAKGWRVRRLELGGKEDSRTPTAAARHGGPARARPGRAGEVALVASAPAAREQVDLRGLAVDQALAALAAAVDAAVVHERAILRVIHGKGTGALRRAVHQALERDPRVAGFRLAPPPAGGTGVTIVEFQP